MQNKRIISFSISIIIMLASIAAYGCSCYAPPSFCKHAQVINSRGMEFIFVGSMISSQEISREEHAFQYSIERVIGGGVVQGPSTLFTNQTFENTDTTVWLLGGTSDLCFRWIGERAIIAVEYITDAGYNVSVCRNDFLKIDDEEMVEGTLLDSLETIKLSVDDVDQLVNDGNCSIRTNTKDIQAIKDEIVVSTFSYGNEIIITAKSPDLYGLPISIHDTYGRQLLTSYITEEVTYVDVPPIPSGLYFVTIYYRESRVAFKVYRN